jgi:uncharacterized membrane protein (DUF2068 family)
MNDFPKPGSIGFRVIGTMKLISGALALAVAIGLFHFFDHDPGQEAERIVSHLGLDRQNQVINTVISRLTGIDRAHLRAVEAGTFFYATLHLIEGIGLILKRRWAEYLVVVATSSLIPFEVFEIAKKHSLLRISLLIVNAGIVIYLIAMLQKQHRIPGDLR